MRKLIGSAVLMVGFVVAPAIAQAQGHSMEAKHEFGVDLGIMYSKPKGGDGTFSIGTPVDVRIGFASGGKIMVEPRFTFNFASGGGNNAYSFTPDINVLFALGGDHKKGGYFTVGAGVNLDHVKISGLGSASTSQFGFNGGFGTRVPYESAAIRLEAVARYLLENTGKGLPSEFQIIGRIGLSLWH